MLLKDGRKYYVLSRWATVGDGGYSIYHERDLCSVGITHESVLSTQMESMVSRLVF